MTLMLFTVPVSPFMRLETRLSIRKRPIIFSALLKKRLITTRIRKQSRRFLLS